MLKARDYQIQDVLKLSRAHSGGGLLALDVGLGKTLVATDTLRNLDFQGKISLATGRVLIIAPLNTHDGWQRTLLRQFGEDLPVRVHPSGSRKTKKAEQWWESLANHDPGVYIIGWEAFRGTGTREQRQEYKRACEEARELGKTLPPRPIYMYWRVYGQFEAVIADEIQRASNRRSTTTKTLWTVDAKWRYGLSATPAGNKVEGYWAVAKWLWPDKYPHFWPWANNFCSVEWDPYSGKKVAGEKSPGLIVRDFPCYIHRTQRQVLKELPEVIEREILVDMLPAQRKIYSQFEGEALAWLENHPVATPLPITQRLRLRQVALGVPRVESVNRRHRREPEMTPGEFEQMLPSFVEQGASEQEIEQLRTELTTTTWHEADVDEVTFSDTARSNKIEALKEIIKDLPHAEPVLVFTHSARFIPAVVHQLNKAKIYAVEWSGRTSTEERQRIKESFGARGGPQVIVAGLGAIGEGVDGLQRVCSTEVWLSQHDNNMLNMQAKGRLLRLGQEEVVNRFVIKSRDTIDLRVYERLAENTQEMQEAAVR